MRKYIFLLVILSYGINIFSSNLQSKFDVEKFMQLRNPTIGNVSVNPNPFSPDNDGVKDETNIRFYINQPGNVAMTITNGTKTYTTSIAAVAGLNVIPWDGNDDNGDLCPDDSYSMHLELVSGGITTTFDYSVGIIIDTAAPQIDIQSCSPNPFSPNEDGYNDLCRIKFNVNDVRISYIGEIEANLNPDSLQATFIDGPNNNEFAQYTEGAYLFLVRVASTIDSDTKYKLTLNGITTDITKGKSTYKLGQYADPQYSVSQFVGMEYNEDEEQDQGQTYNGHDYLKVFALEGNATLNIYKDTGEAFSLNSLYDIYYGDDINDFIPGTYFTYSVDVGKAAGSTSIPNDDMPDGRYIYRIIVTDDVGHESQESGEFVVDNNPIQVSTTINPANISPQNQDALFDFSVIHYQITEDGNVTVKIWDGNTLIRTLQSAVETSAGFGFVLWDGKDDAGNFVSQDSQHDYTAEVTVTDKNIPDEMASVQSAITVDNQSPDAAILDSPSDEFTGSQTLTITARSEEIQADILLLHNTTDTSNAQVIGQTPEYPGLFSFNVDLEEGLNNISILLRDAVGNIGAVSNQISVNLDTQAPVILPQAPENNTVYTQGPILFSSNVYDNGIGVKRVRFALSLNGSTSLTYYDATYNSSTSLYEYSYAIDSNIEHMNVDLYVTANDSLNNATTTSEPITFQYSKPSASPAPVFSQSTPANNDEINVLNSNTISIDFTSQDDVDEDSSYVKLFYPNGDSLFNDYGASQEIIHLDGNNYQMQLILDSALSTLGTDDGTFRIKYNLQNIFGIANTSQLHFVYDTQTPTISNLILNNNDTLTSLNGDNFFSGNIDSLSVDLADLTSGINWASNVTNINLFDSNNSLIQGSKQISGNNLKLVLNSTLPADEDNEGMYSIVVNTKDIAGNVISQTTFFNLVNRQNPTISSSIPNNNSTLNSLPDNCLKVVVNDVNGYGLDENNSTLEMTANGITYSEANNNAILSVTSLGENNYQFTLTLNSPLNTDGGDDGVYAWNINVVDILGESATSTGSFIYDTTFPTISNLKAIAGTSEVNLTDGMTISQSIEKISVDYSDVLSQINFNSNLTNLYLYDAGNNLVAGTKTVVGNSVIWTLTTALSNSGADDGLYKIQSSVTDYAGNILNDEVNFTLSNPVYPTIQNILPQNSVASVNNITAEIVSTVNIDSNDKTHNYVKLTLPDGSIIGGENSSLLTISNNGSPYTFTLTPSNSLTQNGLYHIYVKAQNSYGYFSESESSFNLDTENPTISSIQLSDGTEFVNVTEGMDVYQQISEIKFVANDLGSGINLNNCLVTLTYNAQNLTGNLSASENVYTFTLNNPILVNGTQDGEYSLNISVEDNLAHQTVDSKTFNVVSSNYSITDYVPTNQNTFIHNTFSTIGLKITDNSGIGYDVNNINFVFTNTKTGFTMSNGNGGTLNISQNGSEYQIAFNLTNSLATTGEDDALYNVSINISTNQGDNIPVNYNFTYDSTKPYFTAFYADTQEIYNGSYVIADNISEFSVNVEDLTSGVSFAYNDSRLSLTDENDVLIPNGTITYDEVNKVIKLAFASPILADVNPSLYKLKLQLTDKSGNVTLSQNDFTLIKNADPIVNSIMPDDNAEITSLENNKIVINVSDYLGLNENQTNIILTKGTETYSNNNNASQNISANTDGTYSVELTINDDLDSGLYQISGNIFNVAGKSVSLNSSFTLDKTSPAISNRNIVVDNSDLELYDGRQISGDISSVNYTLTDEFSNIDEANTSLGIYNSSDVLLSNPATVSNGIVTCNLINTLSSAGTYRVHLQTQDSLGNTLSEDLTFTVVENSLSLISANPVESSFIHGDLLTVSMTIKDDSESGLDETNCHLKLIPQNNPDNFIDDGNGASQTITSLENNLWKIELTLINSLLTDGSVDGIYQIKATCLNNLGGSSILESSFTFDNIVPQLVETKVNDNQIVADEVVKTTINSVSVKYFDSYGIDNAFNLTNVVLKNSQNQVISGERSIVGDYIYWTLSTPLDPNNDGGEYKIYTQATDLAGNVYSQNINFSLYPPVSADIASYYPVNNSIKNSVDNIYAILTDNTGYGLSNDDFYLVLNHGTESYFNGQNAIQTIESLGNNSYKYILTLANPLSENGQYSIKVNDADGNETGNSNFIFDNELPTLISSQYSSEGTMYGLTSGSVVSRTIDYFNLQFNDVNLDVTNANNEIYLTDNQGIHISGTSEIINDGLKFTPDTQLHPIINLGGYVLNYAFYDLAGNSLNDQISFTLQAENTPTIISVTPANQSVNNTLTSVVVQIHDEIAIDVNDTFNNYLRLNGANGNSYYNNSNAVQTMTDNGNGDYTLTLNLNYPLAQDGSDDGIYTIVLNVKNTLDGIYHNNFTFKFDTQAPTINEVDVAENNVWQPISDNDEIYQTINSLQVQLAEPVSNVDWQNSSLTLYNENNDVISGTTEIYPIQNKIILNLATPLLQDNQNYRLHILSQDEAGNALIKDYHFMMKTSVVEIVSTNPEENSFVNSSLNSVSVDFSSTSIINSEQSTITLTHPDGNIISDGNGGTQVVTNTGNSYNYALNLSSPFATDGSDDGQYKITLHIVLNNGQSSDRDFNFIYDTRAPFSLNLKLNNTDELIAVNNTRNDYIFTNTIQSLSIDFKDKHYDTEEVSGVDFAPNVTKLFLTDADNIIIDGTRNWNSAETISWDLISALSQIGAYKIVYQAQDHAGNTFSGQINFDLISPSAPQIISYDPNDNAVLNSLPDNCLKVVVNDANGYGLDENLSDILLDNGTEQYSVSSGNATLNISQDQNSNYEITLTPNVNINDGLYSVIPRIQDNIGQVKQDTIHITFDTTLPEIVSTAIGYRGVTSLEFTDNMVIHDSLNFIDINANDILSGIDVSNSTFSLTKTGGNPINGSVTYSNNILHFDFSQDLSNDGSDDGYYSFEYSIQDLAGNAKIGHLTFQLRNENAPIIVSVSPADNSYIAESPTAVNVIINDTHSLNQDNCFIKVTTPDGNIWDNGNGGTLSINQSNPNEYLMSFAFDNVLSLEGNYQIQVRVENSIAYISQENYNFNLDLSAPIINTVSVGFDDDSTLPLEDGANIYREIYFIQMNVSDVFSQINPDSTRLALYDNSNDLIPGVLNWQTENILRYTLNNPLSQIGANYQVVAYCEDILDHQTTATYHFELNAFNGEFISSYPAEGSIINADVSDVTVDIQFNNNEQLDLSNSYILLINQSTNQIFGDPNFNDPDYGIGNGGVMQIENQGNIYTIKLHLQQPLASNGTNDGQYLMVLKLRTALNQTISNSYHFVYDRLNPYFDNLVIAEDESNPKEVHKINENVMRNLQKNRTNYYLKPVLSATVNLGDLTSGLSFASQLTNIVITDENGVVIPGNMTVQDSTFSWVLNNSLFTDGNYKVTIKATDKAGNTLNYEYPFEIIVSPFPIISHWDPEDLPGYFNASLNPVEFKAEIKDHFGIVENSLYSFIKLHFPNGEWASAPYGGNIEYTTTDSTFNMDFTLDGNLHTNGEDDGHYHVYIGATNNQGYSTIDSLDLIYDTVKPGYDFVNVSDNSNNINVEDNSEVAFGINYIETKYNDVTAGMYYVPNLTQITITDSLNNLLPGTLEYLDNKEGKTGEKIVRFTLAQPLNGDGSDDGKYIIQLEATDKSGNVFTHKMPIYLYTPLPPTNFAVNLDAIYQAHLTWDAYVVNKKNNSRALNCFEIYRKINDEEFAYLDSTNDDHYIDSLVDLPDGTYQYKIRANYSAGLSDFVVSDTLHVERFYNVTIHTNNINNEAIPGVRVEMIGDDGLYDMNFYETSDDAGLVELADVFKDEYVITLSKSGFITLKDTISVDENHTSFVFNLMGTASGSLGSPEVTQLMQNAPNPFNPSTVIRFGLKERSRVKLVIYNAKGQKVVTLLDKIMNKGFFGAKWQGKDNYNKTVASGIYFYELQYRNANEAKKIVRKMIMLK